MKGKVLIYTRDYFVRVMNGMALGLFASLIIGLILKQLGTLFKIDMLINFGQVAQYSMGGAIGAGVAYILKASPLGIFSSMICGFLGSGSIIFSGTTAILKIGEPVGAMIASLIGAEISKFVENKTPVNVIVIPISTIIIGGLVGIKLAPAISEFMKWIGNIINLATTLEPFYMGIIVSVLMGIFLTLPISSAAIAISLGLNGLAAGASTIGCSVHMVAFAITSYRENKMSGLFSLGLGTSMLQMPNIIKNPKIFLPPIITSAILGPIGTVIFKIENNSVGAGMGTSGLVGQIMAIETMGKDKTAIIILMTIILPGIISLIISEFFRRKGIIKYGDMKI